MKDKRIAVIIAGALLTLGITMSGCASKSENKESPTTSTTSTVPYNVKQEIKQEPIKLENIRIEKEFEVSDLEQKDEKLIIKSEANTNDATEAYQIGTVLKNSIENLNKDKITKDGIKSFEILLIGKEKSWLYDGSDNIKEIEMN